jgi:hypothetical protein
MSPALWPAELHHRRSRGEAFSGSSRGRFLRVLFKTLFFWFFALNRATKKPAGEGGL